MEPKIIHADIARHFTRRQALCKMGSGFGLIWLANLLGESLLHADRPAAVIDPLAP
jgi:hypothetical protein